MHILKNINIFRNLKLEIALAIPASNDEKPIETIQQDKGQTFTSLGHEIIYNLH